MPALTAEDVESRLTKMSGWARASDEIGKEFSFADFRASMAFVNKVADAANAADHHPDITIKYNKVRIVLSTHSDGGITEKDFTLARQIDAAA